MTSWYENDAFWRENYLVMFSDEAFQRAADEVAICYHSAGLQPRRALDLCCGPGRRRVFAAGAPLSSCVQTCDASFARVPVISFSVSTLHCGYFEESDDDATVLSNMFAGLRPGGTMVIDVVGKELLGRRGDRITDLADGSTCIQRIQVTHDWTMVDSEFILVRGNSTRRYHFTHRLYSGLELRQAMERVGFEVSLLGDFRARLYGFDPRRLVAVGRKPGDA